MYHIVGYCMGIVDKFPSIVGNIFVQKDSFSFRSKNNISNLGNSLSKFLLISEKHWVLVYFC